MASPSRSERPAGHPDPPEPLTARQRAIVQEAARCAELISVFQYPGGRREQLGSRSWNTHAVELPTDAEVRELVRRGYLVRGPVSPATTFAATHRGQQVP